MSVCLSFDKRRRVIQAGYIVSHEGIFHPDRVMHEFDLLYVQQGFWEVYEDGILYELHECDLLLLEPRKHHYSTKKSSEELKLMYIHFAPHKGDLKQDASCIRIPKHINSESHARIESEIKDIIRLNAIPDLANKELVLSTRLEALLLDMSLMEAKKTSAVKTDVKTYTDVTELIKLISENPDRFYSQEELAEAVHLSSRTVSSHFREVTGTSPHAYQIDYKLSLIRSLLKNSPYRTLHDIAVSYGFYDEFQMSKLFKKKYNVSPGECRSLPGSYSLN